MKLQCNRKKFDDALSVVASAAAARASLPILSHVYIEAQSDTVRLVGSDLEQWVECRIPAMVGEDGATTLPARLLTELVGSLGGEDIHIESGDRYRAILTCDDSRYQLMGLPAEEYPPIPDIESPSELALPAKQFLQMVESVQFAVPKEGIYQTLTGVRMEFEDDTLRLAATDTHRLAVRTVRIDSGAAEPTAAIVPLKAIQLVRKIPAGETITLQLGQHRAAFLGENTAVYTQLIEGQYPNYQRVIPQEYTRRWVLMVEEFRNALRRAYLIAKNNSTVGHKTYASKVYLRTDGEKLVITARGDVGEATERVNLVREGDDLEIAFNAKYLLDVLDVLESEEVAVELTESLRPAVFKPVKLDDYLCVIMPMSK
jgi:DNA polymerase-3 subunit beta